MNWSSGGDFTKSLLSLQLQLQTLLEGVGGEETAGLLDGLAKLSETERSIIIPSLTRTINELVNNGQRLMSEKDKELKDFEDSLFNGVLEALKQPPHSDKEGASHNGAPRLAVVDGGKSSSPTTIKKPIKIPTLIDLAKARETRKRGTDNSPQDLV